MGFTKAHRKCRRLRAEAGLENVRLHDLRHSFASMAVSGGASLPVIGALLGHRDVATTARYSHLQPEPIRIASNNIGKSIQDALTSLKPNLAS